MSTILVVVDHPINREFLVSLLSYAGHHTVEAADGCEALEMARSAAPDAIITDILMPRMDDFQFVHQLRALPQFATTPVVFYTASYRLDQAQEWAAANGIQAVLAKPGQPEEILCL